MSLGMSTLAMILSALVLFVCPPEGCAAVDGLAETLHPSHAPQRKRHSVSALALRARAVAARSGALREQEEEDKAAPAAELSDPCVCIFDADRILLGKGRRTACRRNPSQSLALRKGALTLSGLRDGIGGPACGKCLLGVVSLGGAGHEQITTGTLAQLIAGAGGKDHQRWSSPAAVASPFVAGCAQHRKQACARDIADWYRSAGVSLRSSEVHYFDEAAVMGRMSCRPQL